MDRTTQSAFIRRAAVAAALFVGVAVAVWLLWQAVDVFLLAFAGALFAVFLRGLASWVHDRTGISRAWSLAGVTILLVGVTAAVVWLFASTVATETDQLLASFSPVLTQLEEEVSRYAWGRMVLSRMPSVEQMMQGRSDILARATGILSTTLGIVTNIVIILFVGFYLAISPSTYTRGFAQLLPHAKRMRTMEVFDILGIVLWRWVLGRVLLMVSNGVLTSLGLWLLGVPYAITLGIVAGLLNFIPNLGPIIAAIPAVLVALTLGPYQALYVALLYLVLQGLDGYVFTPLVQQQTVEIPPALIILAQVFLGVLLGGLGILLATPIAAVALVLVKLLYVEDVLGDELDLRGVDRE